MDGQLAARFDGQAVGLGQFSAARPNARKACHGGLPLRLVRGGWRGRQGDRSAGPAPGPAWPSRIRGRNRQRTANIAVGLTRSSSNRRRPITGRGCLSSAPSISSCCRASLICDGAATMSCWSRHAPRRAHQDRRPANRGRHCDAGHTAVDQDAPRAGRWRAERSVARRAAGLQHAASDRSGPHPAICVRPKVTTIS